MNIELTEEEVFDRCHARVLSNGGYDVTKKHFLIMCNDDIIDVRRLTDTLNTLTNLEEKFNEAK